MFLEGINESLWTHWHAHLEVLFGLGILQVGYLIGIGPIRRRYNLAAEVDPVQIAMFTTGVLILFVALLSPLHIISDRYLFSAHMVQHVLITLAAPPLLILGTPSWLISPAFKLNWVVKVLRVIVHPVLAFSAFNLVFALWHIPSIYEGSIVNQWLHIMEHLIFISTALLMWWPLTSTVPQFPRLSYPMQIAYLFLLSIAQIALFGALVFAREPIYQWYIDAPSIWSVTPLVDQQIGAIIMKLGGAAIFITLIITKFFRWFKSENKQEILPDKEHFHRSSVARLNL